MGKGVPRIFSLGRDRKAENRHRRPRAGVEFSKPPPHQLGGLWEHCELPQRGSGRNRHRPKGFPLFSALRMASPDTIMLLIVDCHAAIVGWGQDPVPPCVRPSDGIPHWQKPFVFGAGPDKDPGTEI